MNRTRARELASILAAFGEGKAVQWYDSIQCKWQDTDDPQWGHALPWRIKPEPQMYCIVFNRFHKAVQVTPISGPGAVVRIGEDIDLSTCRTVIVQELPDVSK